MSLVDRPGNIRCHQKFTQQLVLIARGRWYSTSELVANDLKEYNKTITAVRTNCTRKKRISYCLFSIPVCQGFLSSLWVWITELLPPEFVVRKYLSDRVFSVSSTNRTNLKNVRMDAKICQMRSDRDRVAGWRLRTRIRNTLFQFCCELIMRRWYDQIEL
jgi:hypothetical protein